MALVKGSWEPDDPVLVRVHSSCATGDILGSMRCDCGDQLHKAMQRIEQAYQSIDSDSDDVKAALHECIKKLHDRPRSVLELRYFKDMGIGDISRQQGVSQNAVRIMLYRVRIALANCVKRRTHIQWETA